MLRVPLVALGLALAVGGCHPKSLDELGYAERQALIAEIREKCRKLTDGSEAKIVECGLAEIDAERARRENDIARRRVGAAILAGGLIGTGAAISAGARRPVSTTCLPGPGGIVRCSTF